MNSNVEEIIEKFLEFPNAKMCKHHAALVIIDKLVDNPSEELVEAVVDADDQKALDLLEDL